MQANNGIAGRMKVSQLTACKMDIINNSNISAKNYTSLNMNAIAYLQGGNPYKVKSVIHLR